MGVCGADDDDDEFDTRRQTPPIVTQSGELVGGGDFGDDGVHAVGKKMLKAPQMLNIPFQITDAAVDREKA